MNKETLEKEAEEWEIRNKRDIYGYGHSDAYIDGANVYYSVAWNEALTKIKAKIKLYHDNGNFDFHTVMNIIDNLDPNQE